MKKSNPDEEGINNEIEEKIEDTPEKPVSMFQKIANEKLWWFSSANRFAKVAKWANINNRQRPGRAASRGR